MPNFNNGPYLKEALDSLFNQTYSDFMIYFVDDCSTDNSVSVASMYDASRIRIIQKHENSGIVETMNIGLKLIDTTYFIRMDGDDISTPDRFQKLVDFMDAHPEIGVCSSDILMFGDENKVQEYGRDSNFNAANLIFGHSIGHASSIFRTSVLKDNQISYHNDFWRMEDYHLFYQLKDVTKVISFPEVLYHYRRGVYNNNPDIEAKKIDAFKLFYQMVLEDLGLESSPDHVAMHLQLTKRVKPTFHFSAFKNHVREIERANREKKIYPVAELEVVLDRYLVGLIYGLIDQKLISFWQVLPFFGKINGLRNYYFRIKLRQIKGQK